MGLTHEGTGDMACRRGRANGSGQRGLEPDALDDGHQQATPLRDGSGVRLGAAVDRLEERNLVRREAAEGDRRVKLLVLTKEGDRMRVEITKRMAEPPPPIASLSEEDQRTLRDILKRALEGLSEGEAEAVFSGKTPAGSK